ncbi:MAG: hypothetical protein CVU40_10100 [Chloroflexi bacterium HGW-Chloroflexi-2]|jgi:GT2 family glycosyltransferase|nr:MAG: hypothetical protein CVU40_10100 [Chloroflexi bacterium HGW-Chloroflexi-2]
MQNFCICIPTYQRDDSLILLLKQLMEQSLLPDCIVIIDGVPNADNTSTVLDNLKNVNLRIPITQIYLPSNHANLPYQRFLGYKFAHQKNYELILFIDDDISLLQKDSIFSVMKPLLDNPQIFGVSTNISFEVSKKQPKNVSSFIIEKLGSSKKYIPGDITPSGNRIPIYCSNYEYEDVSYLSGGVMGYRMKYLQLENFSQDLFALYERKLGKGEDTILSLRVRGKIPFKILCSNKYFFHPDNNPHAYPTEAFRRGYSIAYSRRMINDNYRGINKVRIIDKLELYKSYLGTNIINFFDFLFSLNSKKFSYFWGYATGSLRGIFQKPTTKNLAPHINWWKDAEEALKNMIIIK